VSVTAPPASAREGTTGASPAPVELVDESSALVATFFPGAGMICSSLRNRGDELLAQNAGVGAYAERGSTMGIPLLYPWANRLAGFEYSAGGRVVRVPHDRGAVALDPNGLPIHGVIGGRMAWELTTAPASGGGSLSARLKWHASEQELFGVFPFAHDAQYDADLSAGRLKIELSVRASGEDPVPLAFGFHPYLSLPGTTRERWLIELPAMRRLELDANQIPVGPGADMPARNFELAGEAFDDGFDEVAERARFTAQAEGRRIDVELLEGYPCAQVFSPPGAQFICFEPMTAPANALRSHDGLRFVEPGASFRATFVIHIG
jgi:galactose mutarotase-like enzyme